MELKKRKITQYGNKAVLVERLIEAIKKNVLVVGDGEVEGTAQEGGRRECRNQPSQADQTYDIGSFGEMLEQDDGDIVEEEVNIRGTTIEFHAPTVPQGENVQNHAIKKITHILLTVLFLQERQLCQGNK